jgi:hypothetical protein
MGSPAASPWGVVPKMTVMPANPVPETGTTLAVATDLGY